MKTLMSPAMFPHEETILQIHIEYFANRLRIDDKQAFGRIVLNTVQRLTEYMQCRVKQPRWNLLACTGLWLSFQNEKEYVHLTQAVIGLNCSVNAQSISVLASKIKAQEEQVKTVRQSIYESLCDINKDTDWCGAMVKQVTASDIVKRSVCDIVYDLLSTSLE